MSEDIDLAEAVHQQELDRKQGNIERLLDLRSHADSLRRRGASVVEWHDFQKAHPAEAPNRWGHVLKDGLIGAAIGLALVLVAHGTGITFEQPGLFAFFAAATFGAAGGYLGYYTETASTSRTKQLDDYGKHLEQAERTLARAPQREPETRDMPRADFVARLHSESPSHHRSV